MHVDNNATRPETRTYYLRPYVWMVYLPHYAFDFGLFNCIKKDNGVYTNEIRQSLYDCPGWLLCLP